MKDVKNKFSFIVIVLALVFCVGALSFLFIPNNNNGNYNNVRNSETIDFSNLTMACLGDSITMGSQIDTPYCKVVQNSLGLKKVYNHGISWSTIGYMEDCHCHKDVSYDYNHYPYVYRYDKVFNADIIAVMGGINDFGVDIPLGTIDDNVATTFYGALNILASGLRARFSNSYIFFMTGFRYYIPDRTDDNGIYWKQYNDAIIDVCEKYDIDCFDVYNEIDFDRSVDTVDLVHPTQEFVTNVWSPKIVQFIKDNYKK